MTCSEREPSSYTKKTKPTDKGAKKGYLWAVSAPKLGLVFSIKSVEDIYDFLSILVFLAAVDEVSLDML